MLLLRLFTKEGECECECELLLGVDYGIFLLFSGVSDSYMCYDGSFYKLVILLSSGTTIGIYL